MQKMENFISYHIVLLGCNIHLPITWFFIFVGIAGLVVWYLASGAQGPQINTWLGHSRLGLD